ncbi:hypothetical protein B0H19DRAFT_142611 [Mycena capillaripes]|nr:hypothetical protein B0H19DRAFT_142611 [Mycena capillaripes]
MSQPLPPFQPPGVPKYPPPPASQPTWPMFPETYRDLFQFQMPLTAPDTSTTKTTAPWSGSCPPPIPLCYSYRDPSIPRRALAGLERYPDTYDLWERPTPSDARTSWRQLHDSYQMLPMTQESWLSSVLTILNLIVTALLRDLGLAHSLLAYNPHLLFSQHGDKDWLATGGPLPDAVQALTEVMAAAGGPTHLAVGPPMLPPMIGGGCAFELKLTKVLLEYSHFFAEHFNTFRPLSKYVQGHAIVFKLDLQMQNRVIARRVSSYAPRYGIVYTGQYFLLAENVHPLTILAPYSQQVPKGGPFPRGPPLTSPTPGDTRIRGVGVSPIEHIVGGNGTPFRGFLALLVAINARAGMLDIEDPDPQLTLPGFTAYHQLYDETNAGGGQATGGQGSSGAGNGAGKNTHQFQGWVPPGNSVALVSALIQTPFRALQLLNRITRILKTWVYLGSPIAHRGRSRHVILQFSNDCLSQEPRILVDIPRGVLEGISRQPCASASDSSFLFSPSQLSVDDLIQSSSQVSVYRGRLEGQRVVVKLYEEHGFDGLLREMRAYERLLSLPTVPKCLGVFGPSDKAWAALIIEDRGTSLDSDEHWEDLLLNEREAIYKIAVDIHIAGVHHGDLEARNVVRDNNGRLSIVDFGHATVDHACEYEICAELSDLRQNLGLVG